MSYINTYEVSREYAGPEEGGCFYTLRTAIESIRIRGGVDSDKARQAFNRHAKANGLTASGHYGRREPGFWRSNDQIDHTVCRIESGPAVTSDNWQPYN